MTISPKRIFSVGLVVLLFAFVWVAAGYNAQARMMPLIIGVPVLLLAIWQMVSELRAQPAGGEKTESAEAATSTGANNPLHILGWVLAMFLSVYLFGFIVTTFVYPLLYMRIAGGRSWRMSAAISLGALAFLYIVMIYGLNVDLYDGVLVVALRKAIYGY